VAKKSRKPATGGSPSGFNQTEGFLFPPLPETIEGATARARKRGRGAAPAQEPDYGALLETICGTVDDSQPVEQYNGTLGVTTAFVAAHQRPAGQVQWNANLASIFTNPGNVSGVRWGSGTLITNDLFLTAGHLFDRTADGWTLPTVNGTSTVISSTDIALNMHVNFDYQVDPSGTLRAEQRFAITALVEYRLGGMDFAICRLAGNPGSTFGTTQVSQTDAVVGDMLAIIGHPAGMPKRIEAGPATSFGTTTILYNDIDTLGGNSGSGILHGPSGRLVGIHTNGGCNSSGTGSNLGQRITSVRAASPTLQSLPTATSPIADTTPAMDLATLKMHDDRPTLSFLDTSPSIDLLGTLKFLDDIPKLKIVDDGIPGGFGGLPPIQPISIERPFILATPHHAMGWAGAGAEGAAGGAAGGATDVQAVYANALAELQQTMVAMHEALLRLDAEYRRLVAAYQSQSQGRG
jgi:V8-like Glu-specific endopeptidase